MRDFEYFSLRVMKASFIVGTVSSFILLALGFVQNSPGMMGVGGISFALLLFSDIFFALMPVMLKDQATENTLKLTTITLDEMRRGFNEDTCQSICDALLPQVQAIGIEITDTEKVLGYAGFEPERHTVGEKIYTEATREVIKHAKMQTFSAIREDEDSPSRLRQRMAFIPAGVVVPLIVQEKVVGTLKFFYEKRRDINKAQLAIAWGFGQILSMELSAYELDRLAELTAKAEVKALQAQINPHFLFNTLNTIAALVRTDPVKARNLLREFAVFYRQTLENSESKIPIQKEIEQTKRYLTFEYARFGEERLTEYEHISPACEQVRVPAFIIQPLVENAVRHAMPEDKPLNISILVGSDGPDCLISVIDDGVGMEQATIDRLLDREQSTSPSEKGCGVALKNVAERIEKFYGAGSGLEIMSKLDEGTCVTLRLANVLNDENSKTQS